ncbi:MAG: LysR family transcriptional regulator [Firmicutes bacterium]|nr:LysR family transcriptional regulator [Bacillota bacterium]
MNTSQIRYEIFLKTAQLGNITLAAEAMNYTQSGVSHAIAAMEREAGCTLFHRSKSGVQLTDSGKALLPLVQELVNKQHALDQAMDALSNRVAGRLRIGSFTSFTAIWMGQLIREFNEQFPEVDIELTNGTYREIEDGISGGTLDCGFLSAIENDPLDFQPLLEDEMLVIMGPEHPLAKKKSVSLKSLGDYPLISQFQGSDHDVQPIFRRSGVRPQTTYTLSDDISVMGLVSSSQKQEIALMPELMLLMASFELTARPLSPRQHRSIGLASLPLKESSLLVRTFAAFCGAFFQG